MKKKFSPRAMLINLLLLGCTMLFLLVIGEVSLRVFNIQPMSVPKIHLHQSSDIEGLVYEFVPNLKTSGFGGETITINSEGFRSPEIDIEKPVIAVVGDSFAFGYGVDDDETNPARLAEYFPNYNVVNAGVNGYNIEQETLLYEAKISALDPELTIVEFFFNDMDPKGYFDDEGIIRVGWRTQEEEEELIRKSITRKGLINFPGKYFLQTNSAVFTFVERTTKWLPFRKHATDITTESLTDEQLRFYEEWFVRLSAAIGDRKKLFVIWPDSNLHLRAKPALMKLAEREGFIVLDLYDRFGNGYPSLGWDWHPKASVQREVGDLMAQIIKDRDLLRETE